MQSAAAILVEEQTALMLLAYIKEQDERERALVLEYLNAHGSRQYTMDDILRQEVWQQNQCCDWNHCYVHEITLVE